MTGESTILVFAYRDGEQFARTWFDFATTSDAAPWAHPNADATATPCATPKPVVP